MAAPKLVEADMVSGRSATEAIWKDATLKPTAIFWLFHEESSEWRFVIATADVNKRGPQASYLRVRKLLQKADLLERLPLRRVFVTDPSNPLVKAVCKAVATPIDQIADVEFYDCTFFGMEVPGLHAYVLHST